MKPEDLKAMASRCRRIAGTADAFTKRRLLDLALKYEARLEGPSLASGKLGAIAATGQRDPTQETRS